MAQLIFGLRGGSNPQVLRPLNVVHVTNHISLKDNARAPTVTASSKYLYGIRTNSSSSFAGQILETRLTVIGSTDYNIFLAL